MLENNSIKLRSLEMSDVDLLYAWENDRANWKVSHTITPYSKYVLTDYINAVSDIYSDKQLRLIIESKADGMAVGTIDLFDCDFVNRRAGIGILISDPTHRGKGIGGEVLGMIIDYCFKVLNMHQLYCNILNDNPQSMALFEKFGFEKIGIKKDWTLFEGKYYDEVLLQKIRENG